MEIFSIKKFSYFIKLASSGIQGFDNHNFKITVLMLMTNKARDQKQI